MLFSKTFGSHSFPYRFLLLGTIVPNDLHTFHIRVYKTLHYSHIGIQTYLCILNSLMMVTLLCTVSTTLDTVQVYTAPTSSITKLIIVRFLVTWYVSLKFTSVTTTVELVLLITYLLSVKLLQSALHQVIDGTGTPVAVQVIVILSPSAGLTSDGVVTVGWATYEHTYTLVIFDIKNP